MPENWPDFPGDKCRFELPAHRVPLLVMKDFTLSTTG